MKDIYEIKMIGTVAITKVLGGTLLIAGSLMGHLDLQALEQNGLNTPHISQRKIVDEKPNEVGAIKLFGDTKGSEEFLQKLEEFCGKLDLLELLGETLKPEDYLFYGNKHLFKGAYESALKKYDESLKLNPNLIGAWNNKGVAYFQLKRFEEACGSYNEAIKLEPDFAVALYNRGYAYTALGEEEKAISDFKTAIEIDSSLEETLKRVLKID